MAVVSKNITLAISKLRVARGEIQNVHSAAMRDLTFAVKKHVEMGWPRDTSTSLAGWTATKTGTVSYSLSNDVGYSGHVWNNVSDPIKADGLALATPLFLEGVEVVMADVVGFLSDRVKMLLIL